MSDNELDNLFKEAAEGFKAPKDPSAWDTMSKRLDDAGVGTSGFWNWKTISTIGVVGITGIASVLYFANTDVKPTDSIAVLPKESNQTNETVATTPTESVASDATTRQTAPSSQKGDTQLAQENKVAIESSEEKTKATDETKATTRKTPARQTAPSGKTGDTQLAQENKVAIETSEEETKATDETKGITHKTPTRQTAPSGQTGNIPLIQVDKVIATREEETIKASEQEEIKRDNESLQAAKVLELNKQQSLTSETDDQALTAQTNPQRTENAQAELVANDSVELVKEEAIAAKEEESPVEENKSDDKKEKIRSRGLAIKLAIAPDYSAVEKVTPSGLGFSYGVLFEYRLSSHWSIATGGIWEKKIYSAKEVEYNGHTADRVDGDCRMWDIPINVYYAFAPARRLSFYTSVGFSSYIMNKENYVLYYDGAYGSYDYPLEVKGENNEWFKMLNFSVGMQMRLSNVISLQVEPTLKAPLAGVGEGEVSLVSLGAFFNIRFDIPIKK